MGEWVNLPDFVALEEILKRIPHFLKKKFENK